jgi:hypothetical protein
MMFLHGVIRMAFFSKFLFLSMIIVPHPLIECTLFFINSIKKLKLRNIYLFFHFFTRRLVKMSDGSLGSGAGKGGGTGGSIRDAGGAFGKMEVAHEEEYFYKQVNSTCPFS